jgi:hypothetical protein
MLLLSLSSGNRLCTRVTVGKTSSERLAAGDAARRTRKPRDRVPPPRAGVELGRHSLVRVDAHASLADAPRAASSGSSPVGARGSRRSRDDGRGRHRYVLAPRAAGSRPSDARRVPPRDARGARIGSIDKRPRGGHVRDRVRRGRSREVAAHSRRPRPSIRGRASRRLSGTPPGGEALAARLSVRRVR